MTAPALALAAYAGLAALAAAGAPWSEHLGPYLVLHALAWVAAWRAARSSLGFGTILAGAVLFRALMVPLAPSLSDDIYRYVWEGRVQRAGFDPYVLAPGDPRLAALRDALWARVNHPEYAAIYPPLAQLAFKCLAGAGGVTLFKAFFTGLDVATCVLLGLALRRRGQPAARLALYAWNPLAVVEVAGSGHLEPLGVLPLVAAVLLAASRPAWSWAAFAASVAAKYAAAVVLPALARAAPPRPRALLAALAVLAAACAAYAGAGSHLFDSLRVYAQHWRYNDLAFSLLERVVPDPEWSRLAAALLVLALCVAIGARRGDPAPKVLAALTVALVLSPTVHPWYLLWPLAFLPLAPNAAVFAWSGTIALAYVFLHPAWGLGPAPRGSWGLAAAEMVPVAALALAPLVQGRRRRPGSMGRAAATAESERMNAPRIVVVIPALDEEQALPHVLADLEPWRRDRPLHGPALRPDPLLDEIVVVDNGSRDRTPEIARAAGATVLHEPRRGYGAACLRALAHLRGSPPDVVVFMDADHSDDVADLRRLLDPVLAGRSDLAIGSRTLGRREPGALLPQARLGNWLATGWIRHRYGFRYTDLGPFRAVRFAALERLGMADRDWGWTLEMQVRALQEGLRVVEVPVCYRRRIGKSKISGTIVGSVRAGRKIVATLWKLRGPGRSRRDRGVEP